MPGSNETQSTSPSTPATKDSKSLLQQAKDTTNSFGDKLQNPVRTANSFGDKLQNPKEAILNRLGLNKLNEDAEKQALAQKTQAQTAEEFKQPEGGNGETFYMAMMGKKAMAAGKQLREECKQLDKNRANSKAQSNTDQSNTSQSTTSQQNVIVEDNPTNTEMQDLAKQFDDLGKVLTVENVVDRATAWGEYAEEYKISAETQLPQHMLALVNEYRELTNTTRQPNNDDVPRDAVSALEDSAKYLLENNKYLEVIEKDEAKEVATTLEEAGSAIKTATQILTKF